MALFGVTMLARGPHVCTYMASPASVVGTGVTLQMQHSPMRQDGHSGWWWCGAADASGVWLKEGIGYCAIECVRDGPECVAIGIGGLIFALAKLWVVPHVLARRCGKPRAVLHAGPFCSHSRTDLALETTPICRAEIRLCACSGRKRD